MNRSNVLCIAVVTRYDATYWKRSRGKQDTDCSTSRSILPKELTVEALLSIHHLNNRLAGYAREIEASPCQLLESFPYSVNGISESSSTKVSLIRQSGHLQIRNFHQTVFVGYLRIRIRNQHQPRPSSLHRVAHLTNKDVAA